jgi:hypothetical protein
MRLTIHKNTVYEFEDFLSIEEQNKLLQIATNIGENWDSANNEWWMGKMAHTQDPIIKEIEKRLHSMFISYDHINYLDAINRFIPGVEMGEHTDEVGHEDIKYGIVIYINDDFNGGEICYQDLDMIHKPKARSLVIHPGNVKHSVNKVLPGPTRYSMTTFVHGTESTPAIIKTI